MPRFWIWLAATVCSAELILCQNCTSVSVRPTGEPGNPLKWTYGVKNISFLIEYNCSSTYNLTVLWTVNSTTNDRFRNGNISSTSPLQSGEWKLSFSGQSGTFNSTITLYSDSMQNSSLNVTAGEATNTVELVFQSCEGGENFDAKRQVDCSIPNFCPDEDNVAGKKDQTCGEFAEWIGQECVRPSYLFNFDSSVLKAPRGQVVTINCDKANLQYDGTIHNETVEKKLEFADHGKVIACYEKFANETNAGRATVVVTSVPVFPHAKTKAEAVEGESFSLRLLFYANPRVTVSDTQVWHSGKPVSDYFFRTISNISQEIMMDFAKVDKGDFGLYNVTVTGKNEYCNSTSRSIAVDIVAATKPLTPGWIVAIGLGSLVLVLLIVISWMGVTLHRRKASDGVDVSQKTSQKSKPNKYTQQDGFQNPAIKLQPSHTNQSFDDDDDDEFDDDDYEQPTSPMSERPPMPLPPTARNVPPPPRSPRRAERPMNDRPQLPPPSPHRGRPLPPPSGRPPPPHRGVMPPPRGVGAGNTLAPHGPGYQPRDYQEDYLNEDESRAATLRMQHMRR